MSRSVPVPADVIDDKAARLLALVDRLYERMHPDGTVVTERVATKEEIVDRVRDVNGEPRRGAARTRDSAFDAEEG